jgi:DNA polymerase-4
MRQIIHIDMNSYFATVEQQANPKLRGKPIAVLGSHAKRTIIVAASIEAKRYGVKTGTPIEEAYELCPDIIMVHGEPRKYSSVTKQFISIFEDFTDKVEIFSIDEAFLDVTATAHLYISSPCKIGDFDGAINIAKKIKKRIREEIGSWISCSAGVSYNKFLAKTGSDLQKPDGLVTITKENVDEVLLNLPLKDYCGIGKRIHQRLGALGIYETKQLRDFPSTLLNKEFGIATGQHLKRMVNGLDNSHVVPWREQKAAKSFGHSRTFNRDVLKRNDLKEQTLLLCEKVAKRMRDDGYWGREVGIWVRFKDFTGAGKRMRIGKWTCDGLEIYKATEKILAQIEIRQPVRAVGVSVAQTQLQQNVPFSFLEEDRINEKIHEAQDAVNNRFGSDVVTRGTLKGIKLKEIVSGMGRKKF